MKDILCQPCGIKIPSHRHCLDQHAVGKRHKAKQAKETFEQEMARTVVLQGFNVESPILSIFSELQKIFHQFGRIEGFQTHTASQEVDVRFYNNQVAEEALSAGSVLYKNEKLQIYKKFRPDQKEDEILKCPPPPEISERPQACLPSPSEGIDPPSASSCQLTQPVDSALHPDTHTKDWKIKYRTEYQDPRIMDRSRADSRDKLMKPDLEDRYQNSTHRSNELTDSRNLYPNSSSQELPMHDLRTTKRQVLMDSSFSQRNLKGASGEQDYRYQLTERNHSPAESQNHSLPFYQYDGRDQIMLTESINHQDIDDRRTDAIVRSTNNQIYLPDSHYQDHCEPSEPTWNHRSRSRDFVEQVPASHYQTRADLDSQGSRKTMLDYNRRPRDAVEDTHFRSAEGPKNLVLDYNRSRDVIEGGHIRTTQGPRAPIPEYNRSREGPDDGHVGKTIQGVRNSVPDHNRPREVIQDNHIRTTHGIRNSDLNYSQPKGKADDSHSRTVRDSRNLLSDYKRLKDMEDNHRSTGISESDYKRGRDVVEDNYRSTQGLKKSEPEFKRGRDLVEDSYRYAQGPRNSEPEYKRAREIVEDNHRSAQGSRDSEPEYKRARDAVEDNRRSSQGHINSDTEYKGARDIVGDNHRSAQGPRNSEPEYKRAREIVGDNHRSAQGPRDSEPEYKRARDAVEDNRRSSQGHRNSDTEYKGARDIVGDNHRSAQGHRDSEPEYKRARDVVEDNHRSAQGPRNSEPECERGRDLVKDSHRSAQGHRNLESEYKRERYLVEDSHRSAQGSRSPEPDYKRARVIVEDNHRSSQGHRNSDTEYKRARDVVEDNHRSAQGFRNSDTEYKRARDAVEDNHRSAQGRGNLELEYKRARSIVEDNHRSTYGPRNSEPEYKRARDNIVDDSRISTQGPRNLEPEYKRGRDVEDDYRSTEGSTNSEPEYKRVIYVVEDNHRSTKGLSNSESGYKRGRDLVEDGADNAHSRKSSHSLRDTVDDYGFRKETENGNIIASQRALPLRPSYSNETSETRTLENKSSPVRNPNPLVEEYKDSSIGADPKLMNMSNKMLSCDLKGDFDSQMTSFVYELRRFENDSMKMNHALTDIERAMQNEYPGCQVLPSGANVTGLFAPEVVVEFYLKFTMENKNKLAGPDDGDGRIEKASARVTAEILGVDKAFTPLKPFQSRTHRVELHHLPTALLVSISLKASTLARNELLKFLISTDGRLKKVFLFIKYWTAVYLDDVVRGIPSKYYLMLLVIFYLQRLPKPILPPIHFLQKDSSYNNFVNGWNIGFNDTLPLRNISENKNTSSIKTLLEGFFEFYSKFKFDDVIISPYVGDVLPLQMFHQTNKLPPIFDVYKSKFQAHYMNVQDPFEHDYNASIHLSSERTNVFQNQCMITLSHFQECRRTGLDKGLLNRIFLCNAIITFVDDKEMCTISVLLPMDKHLAVSEECAMLTFVRLNKLLANMLTDVLKSKFTCEKEIEYNSEGALCSPQAKYVCVLFFNLWSSRSISQTESESNSIIERETGVSDKIIDSLYRNQTPACPILVFDLDACIKIESKAIYLNLTCADIFSETFKEFFTVCGPMFECAVKELAERVTP